jgi:hypothetical protein
MKKVFLIILTCIFSLGLSAQSLNEIPGGISLALKAGSSSELMKYMNDNVEMVILDKEGIYDKSQAEMILKDFFSKNQPRKFSLLHQGGKSESKYGIGDLETANESFRVYFLLKEKGGKPLIHQFRIEKENG